MCASFGEVFHPVDIAPRTSLETVMVQMQTANPGQWDFRLKNALGRLYIESRVGLNPVAHGYSQCVDDRVYRTQARNFLVNRWGKRGCTDAPAGGGEKKVR